MAIVAQVPDMPTGSDLGVNCNANELDGLETFNGNPWMPKLEIGEQTLHYTNGDTYTGETLGTLRHGQGVHQCSNGDTHSGKWYQDKRHGFGVATFARGLVYEGEWHEDKAQGFGKAKYENGAVYEGEFMADQRVQWGRQVFPDGSVYEGEWAADKMTGRGRMTYEDGSFFEGVWVEGERLKGKWQSADGKEEYSGAWQGQLRHGFGTGFQKGLFQYMGEWEADLRHGQGKCRWGDGSAYDGSWKEGVRSGRGVFVANDGYKYDGMWKDDKEHGEGNARLTNGDRYTGEFQAGAPSGQGRCLFGNGDRYDGEWLAGKRSGQGRCSYANGDKYQGAWANDKRHGEGICRFADGTVFQGLWEEDQWLQSEAEPSLSRVIGAGMSRATAGVDTSITILAKDELRNRRLCGGDSFVVWLEGPATVHATVLDSQDGTYLATYNTKIAGNYQLYITNDTGEPVAEAPYPLRVVATCPAARKSLARGDGCKQATVEKEANFSVEARDEYGNRCRGAALPEDLPIEIELTCGSHHCPVDISHKKDGTYSCTYTPAITGFYRLKITSGGKPLGNSPISVQVFDEDVPKSEPKAETAVEDKSRKWASIAAAEYKADGNADGWDSDASDHETAEQKYIKAHPEVPVVEKLEDMWKVGKLQRERKARMEHEQALQEQQLLKAKQATEAVVVEDISALPQQLPGHMHKEEDPGMVASLSDRLEHVLQ